MITVYKKKSMGKGKELITLNDVFFNRYSMEWLDENAAPIIQRTDGAEMIDKYTIRSRFDGSVLNIDKLSTGCKTVLNIMYNRDKIFDIRECGDNALDEIYALPFGNVYCDYPFISFDMEKVQVCDKHGIRIVDSYEELKEWWSNED